MRPQPRLGLTGKWFTFENVLLHQLLLNKARILSDRKVILINRKKEGKVPLYYKKKKVFVYGTTMVAGSRIDRTL